MKLDLILTSLTSDLEVVRTGLLGRLDRLVARQNLADGEIETISHLFSTPGKLIRPALVLLSARATGLDTTRRRRTLVDLSIAVELVHSASLIHDDIVDAADERRGQPSMNRRFGSAVAVLAGDILYAEFFLTLLDLPGTGWPERGELFRRFAVTTQRMCFGEMHEHRLADGGRTATQEEYLDIVERKTADLMAVCCAGGAIAAGADTDTVRRLGEFGMAFGMAFQLVDDALDGDALFGTSGAAAERARAYVDRARDAIAPLPAGPGHRVLVDLCDYVLERAATGVDRL